MFVAHGTIAGSGFLGCESRRQDSIHVFYVGFMSRVGVLEGPITSTQLPASLSEITEDVDKTGDDQQKA